MGSIVALTNPAAQEVFPAAPGRVVERYTYDPYGRTLIEKCNQSTGLPVERLAASRFGNPFAWTGQRYDAGVKLYHFLHRSYSPRLGRWLQRDPLGYVDGVSLYEYVASAPTGWIDPLGLKLKVGGTPAQRKRIEERLQEMCPGAKVDPKTGDVSIEAAASPPASAPASQPSSGPTSQDKCGSKSAVGGGAGAGAGGAGSPGCAVLQKLIDSKTTYVIRSGKDDIMRKTGSPGRFRKNDHPPTIFITENVPVEVTNQDGSKRQAEPWEVLLHEILHAKHYDDGTYTNDAQEEVRTIEEENGVRTWRNSHNAADSPDMPLRDPYSHSEATERLRPHKRP